MRHLVNVVSVRHVVEVRRGVRNQLRHPVEMSGGVRNCIDMISVWNVVDVGRRVRAVSLTVPGIDWPERGVRYPVDMSGRMRDRMQMVPVRHIVDMRRRMRNIMEMGLVVALGVGKLCGNGHSCDCQNTGDNAFHFVSFCMFGSAGLVLSGVCRSNSWPVS